MIKRIEAHLRTLTNDSLAIERAVLTLVLVASALKLARGHFDWNPVFDGPARIIEWGCMICAGHFAVDGPIQAGGRWTVRVWHGSFSKSNGLREAARPDAKVRQIQKVYEGSKL